MICQPVENSKKKILSLPDGADGLISLQAEFLPPGTSHPNSGGVHAVSSLMNSFHFVATFRTVTEP